MRRTLLTGAGSKRLKLALAPRPNVQSVATISKVQRLYSDRGQSQLSIFMKLGEPSTLLMVPKASWTLIVDFTSLPLTSRDSRRMVA